LDRETYLTELVTKILMFRNDNILSHSAITSVILSFKVFDVRSTGNADNSHSTFELGQCFV
jgi:hypothetical protein